MKKALVTLGATLTVCVASAQLAQAHELRRLGTGNGEFGERFRLAFGMAIEPAREDQENGIDFTSLFYEDGSFDGNVIDAANGDKVDIRKITALFFKPGPPDANGNPTVGDLRNSEVICDRDATPPNTGACISQNQRQIVRNSDPIEVSRNDYENKFRPTHSGIYGFKLTGCIADNVEQEDEFAATPYAPSGDFCLNEETFICGVAGSKDPRNNPGDPEFDPLNQRHTFSCITDAVAFGANKQVNGRDKDSYRDNDVFNLPDSD